MPILFRPPLAATVRVRAPPCEAPAQLFFTATFPSRQDYDECRHTGARLELWSNADTDDHWVARPFTEWKPLSSGLTPPTLPNVVHALPLGLDEDSRDDNSVLPDNALFVSVSTPQAEFEYTFRLVYPSGEVRWLGHAYNNGRVITDKSDPALLLHPSWHATAHSHSLSWRANDVGADGVEVAQLCPDLVRTAVIWGLAYDGLSLRHIDCSLHTLSHISDCSSVIVTFRSGADTDSVASPSLALHASPGASISASSLGAFTFFGSGDSSLLLRAYEPGMDLNAFIDNASQSPYRFRLVGHDAQTSTVVLACPTRMQPISVLAVSLLPNRSSEIRIQIRILKELAPNVSRLALFCHATSSVRIFDDLLKHGPDDVFALTAGPAGGHFVICSLHFLCGENASWDIAVLAPHVPVVVPDHSLPTPPASPALRPIPPLSVSTPMHTNARMSPAESPSGAPSVAGVCMRQAQTSQGSLRRILALLVVLLRFLFGAVLTSWFGRRRTFGRKTASVPDDPAIDSTASAPVPQLDLPEAARLEAASESFMADTSGGSQPFVVNTLVGGQISIILRSRSADPTISEVAVKYDDVVTKDLRVKEIGEATYLVDFYGGAQGSQIKVSFR